MARATEELTMIIVRNRELLIPKNEQYIGTTYDTNADNRQFQIDRVTPGGVDLANLIFTLDIEYHTGDKNSVLLDKEVSDGTVILTWPITESQLQITGTAFIDLRAVNNIGGLVKWASFRAPVYIEDTIYTPGSYTGDLTELEQMEAKFGLFTEAENERKDAELERKSAEFGRVNAENGRVAAENAREADFAEAIADFNEDRQVLKAYRDDAVQAEENAAMYTEICAAYAGITLPIFSVDFPTGHLVYTDTAAFAFAVNTTSGNLEYEYTLT